MANSSLISIFASEAAKKQALIQAKKGKTSEQKDAIDFFAKDGSGCGCLGGSTMSMSAYISKVQEKCRTLNLRARAIQRLAIDEGEATALIDPICLYNFEFSDDDAWIKIEDNQAVSSKYTVTWMFFSETQIYLYSYTFDMTSDDVEEYCREYFYQDITCFEVENDIVEKIDINVGKGCLGGGCLGGESIRKNNYTVDSFKITVPGSSCEIAMKDAGAQMKNIQAAKALLRERKFIK